MTIDIRQDGDTVVLLDYSPVWGEHWERRFWVQPGCYGNIYEVTPRRPGIHGKEVCTRLKHRGRRLWATPETLLDVIRIARLDRDIR